MKYNYKKFQENLSDNIICNWSILKNNKIKKNNIISVCFFFIKGNTKNDKYINGIKHIIENFILFKTFILRIYFDESVKEILYNILESVNIIDTKIFKKIELFQYDIPFMKEDDYYHKPYIGTLLRFLPLFDNLIHKANKCLVLDIDNIIRPVYKKIIDTCDKKKIKVCYRSSYGYSLRDRVLCLSDKIIIDYPIIASFIYKYDIDIPYNLLSNFFEKIFFENNMNLLDKCGIEKYNYGIDEIFINKIFFNYIYNNNILLSPIIFNHFRIHSFLYGYVFLINTIKELNDYTYFLNIFFKLLKLNIKLNKFSHGKIKNLKYIVGNIIRKNEPDVINKLNNLLVNNDELNIVKNFVIEKIEKINKKNKENLFSLFLKYLFNSLDDIKIDKVMLLLIDKNSNLNSPKKMYINEK